jgi:predicted methyltransferase
LIDQDTPFEQSQWRNTMNKILPVMAALFLIACQPSSEVAETAPAKEVEIAREVMADDGSDGLAAALAAQPDEVRARYQYRHPRETIKFFGIEPGMTVVEGLPGGGWYTKILLPYLGAEGCVIGADYSLAMYPLFGWASDTFLQEHQNWLTDWTRDAEGWRGENGACVKAFHFGSMPDQLKGTADVVFFARVLHNLANFEKEGGFLTAALNDAYSALKPGGTFGVVQHEAGEDMSDSFADGSHGYLKKSFVIAVAEKAGFELIAESGINRNPADQPGEDDIVWRLAPSFATSRDNPELRARYETIGESNRMTLKFRKPE